MIITDNIPEIKYQAKNQPGVKHNKSNYKSGQRKLLVTEIEFLTVYGHLSDTVLYIGSAPGYHLDILINSFPNIKKWIFYDIGETKIKYINRDNIEIHKEYFTCDLAKEYKDIKPLFISDIRRYHLLSGKHSVKEADRIIVEDMQLQKELVENGNFIMSSLKFRLPWEWETDTTRYFDGELHTTPWLGEYSPELRLFTDGKTYREYSHSKIDNQMYWYNTVKRREDSQEMKDLKYKQYDYDQVLEYNIIKKYIKEPNEGSIFVFINMNCVKFKEKYRY